MCCLTKSKSYKMKEQELNDMINNSILNRDGMMSLEQSDVDAIRNAGTLLDGGQATCDAESLSATLQDVYSSIAAAHPEQEVMAILVQLEANGTEQVHTAVQAFLDTLGDIDALWSIDSKLPTENVNVFMLVSMGKK
jgi:hypothetical protein